MIVHWDEIDVLSIITCPLSLSWLPSITRSNLVLPYLHTSLYGSYWFNEWVTNKGLVYFYRCKEMVPTLDRVSTLLNDKIHHPVKIDIEKYPTIATKNRIIEPFLAYIIFKDGKPYHYFVSYIIIFFSFLFFLDRYIIIFFCLNYDFLAFKM